MKQTDFTGVLGLKVGEPLTNADVERITKEFEELTEKYQESVMFGAKLVLSKANDYLNENAPQAEKREVSSRVYLYQSKKK